MLTFNVRTTLNEAGLKQKAFQARQATQMQLDNDVLKDSNYFIPKDTGQLEQSSISSSLIGKGTLYWNTKYARKLYYNPQFNFSKDRNPNAQGLWFEAAKARRKPNWIQKVKQGYSQYFNGR